MARLSRPGWLVKYQDPRTVTNPSRFTNPARSRATSLMCATSLLTTNPNRHRIDARKFNYRSCFNDYEPRATTSFAAVFKMASTNQPENAAKLKTKSCDLKSNLTLYSMLKIDVFDMFWYRSRVPHTRRVPNTVWDLGQLYNWGFYPRFYGTEGTCA